jgi:two-component system sensor histidine kinase QseC
MIHSIRRFLLISLLIAITIASSITAIGNYLLDKQIIQPYLDEQLIKIFQFSERIHSLIDINELSRKEITAYLESNHSYVSANFMFQIYNNEGKLILHSGNAPLPIFKNTKNGFSDVQIKDSDWRVYSNTNTKQNIKIVVAEIYDIRNDLADLITRNNAYILLVTYPIFGVLIWIIVGLALRSISRVSTEISNRASTYLEPMDPAQTPIEIKPLVIELNHLFVRLQLAFDRNKRFSADAAHELRTPLAALKTQTQVALKATHHTDREQALLKVLQGVDRSSHVVAQLLTLSRLNQEETLNDIHPIDLHKITTEILTYLVPFALEKGIEIELAPSPTRSIIMGNDTAIGILVRNVVDNAIRYTPPKGSIKVEILSKKNGITLRVTDTGPGIPPELRERVFERFYRVLGTTAPGSGLGLAIVNQIAELHHAHIILSTPPNGKGLQFDVIFPNTTL